MSRRACTFVLALLLPSLPGAAATFCVADSASLRAALAAAQANGQDDVVQVVQGVYLATDPPAGPFTYLAGENYSLQLLGGYVAGCGSRVLNPTNTVLDGGGTQQVLTVTTNGSSTGDLLVEGFTVRNGYTTSAPAVVGATINATGSATVRLNIFRMNTSTGGNAGALAGGVWTGTFTLSGNLFVSNYSTTGAGAAEPVSRGGTIYVVNNTATMNTGVVAGGIYLDSNYGFPAAVVANNVLWGNNGNDLYFSGIGAATVMNNDIGNQSQTGGTTFTNTANISTNPLFVGGADYHLSSGSPAVNTGSASLPAGASLPTQDLDGNARVIGAAPDMGAYESATTPVELVRFGAE